MNTLQRSIGQWLLLILSIAGAAIAVYLTSVHYENVPLICSSQGLVNCERVTSSAYSIIPGTNIPITLPGIAWFIVMAALAIAGLRSERRAIRMIELIWSILGMFSVLYLVYAEIVALHAICAWCTGIHIIIFVSLIISIIEVYRSGLDTAVEPEESEETVTMSR